MEKIPVTYIPLSLPSRPTPDADLWIAPAKQNIFSEEYVIDEKGQRHFLGCAIFTISSDDLMNVTSENYLYDGELILRAQIQTRIQSMVQRKHFL